MKKWWKRKNEKMRKNQKTNGIYTFGDFVLDVLLWIPELILFPFRLVFWFLRGIVRLIGHLFDIG